MLPFEPMGWTKDFRSALREAVARLIDPSLVTVARVWDGERRVHDLENAVMYNIGLACFGPTLAAGLWLRRHPEPFLDPYPHSGPLLGGPVAAQYSYAAVDAVALPPAARSADVRWSFTLPSGPVTVRETWRCARTALLRSECADVDLANRRLTVSVDVPAETSPAAIKLILDGIVSALHVCREDAVQQLQNWRADADEIELFRCGPAPLGERRLIVGGTRPAWNPADDLVDEIVLRPVTRDRQFTVSLRLV
jgi:hypothetical protein